jgi:transposase
LEAEIRRVDCPHCGVRTEEVPWARPGARHSRDFQDVVAWLCQRMDKTSVCRLMHCSWEAVDRIVAEVVDDYLDESRLDDLYRIGVDEIAYRRGHRYLTIVADHDSGRVVWVAKDRSKQALTSFYDALGDERRGQLEAVSMDMSSIYQDATREAVPHAAICCDPFHLMQWVNRALDSIYSQTPRAETTITSGRQWQRTRTALRTGKERLDRDQRKLVNELRRQRHGLFRAWELKEQFRALFRTIAPTDAARYLELWCRRAMRSKLRPFVTLVRRIRAHFDGIINTVHYGLSNSRLEGINAKIRLINNRAHGHRSITALSNSIYLCLGGITIALPTQR